MNMALSSHAWFYKDLFPVTLKSFQPFGPSLQFLLQPHIHLLDLQTIIMEYARHYFQGEKKSTLHVGKVSRYLAMTAVGDTLFIADGDNHINAYECVSTEEWQRTGFWTAGSMVTQLGSYGPHLVSSDYNGEVSVWNPSNGELVRNFTGHTGRVVAFVEVAGRLATCSFDKTVRLWTLSQTQQVDQIVFQSSLPTCMVAWNGQLAVGDSRCDIRIFGCEADGEADGEEDGWTCIWTFGIVGHLTSLAISPHNNLLFVVDGYVYSIPPNKSSIRVPMAHDRLDKCVCSVDDTLVVGYSNKYVARIELFKNQCRTQICIESVRGMVAVGGRLAVATSGGRVTFVD